MSQRVIRQLAVSLKDSSNLTLTLTDLRVQKRTTQDNFRKGFHPFPNLQFKLFSIRYSNLEFLNFDPLASQYIKVTCK
jgi:hypothetical protein